MKEERYEDALEQVGKLLEIEPECYKAYGLYGRLLEKKKEIEPALLSYIKYIEAGNRLLSSGCDYREIYDKDISSNLEKLAADKYTKQFYAPAKEREFSLPQLSILLVLLGKYDAVSEQFRDMMREYYSREDREGDHFLLLVFTIKLSIWLKLIEPNVYETMRLADLYIAYIKSLPKEEEKEKEVLSFSLELFRNQYHLKADPENIKKILERLNNEEGVPFSSIIMKIWTCLKDPDSLEARKYLTDVSIANVVEEIKKKSVSLPDGCDPKSHHT